jgi:ABC-2 type transport system permease protein
MDRFWRIFNRDFLNLLCNPMWVFYCTLFPLLLILILGWLGSGNYGSQVNAYDYYGITMVIYAIFNTSTIAANSFMEERIRSGNLRLIYAPISTADIYLSKVAATFVFASLCHLALIAMLHWPLGVNFGGSNTLYVIVLLLLLELFSSALGILLCCICKSENLANRILSIVVNLCAVLGGLFFPPDGLGRVLSALSCLSPAKWSLQAIFALVYDSNLNYLLPAYLLLTALSAAAVGLCHIFFRTEDYL